MIMPSIAVLGGLIIIMLALAEWKAKYSIGALAGILLMLLGIMVLTDGIAIENGTVATQTGTQCEDQSLCMNLNITTTTQPLYSPLTFPFSDPNTLIGMILTMVGLAFAFDYGFKTYISYSH